MIILWVALGILGAIWIIFGAAIWIGYNAFAELRRKPKREVLAFALTWPFRLKWGATKKTFGKVGYYFGVADRAYTREELYKSNPPKYAKKGRR